MKANLDQAMDEFRERRKQSKYDIAELPGGLVIPRWAAERLAAFEGYTAEIEDLRWKFTSKELG